jgi:hypothetical protein
MSAKNGGIHPALRGCLGGDSSRERLRREVKERSHQTLEVNVCPQLDDASEVDEVLVLLQNSDWNRNLIRSVTRNPSRIWRMLDGQTTRGQL